MGDGSGCLKYELALAKTDKLIGEGWNQHGLLTDYRSYFKRRSALATVFRA